MNLGEAGRFAPYNPGLPLASARPQGAEGGQFRCGVTRDTALHTYRGAPWLAAPAPCPAPGRGGDSYGELWRTYGGGRGWTMTPYY